MTHPIFHAESSVRRFGGKNEDYLPIHQWLDSSKREYCDFRHRALRHLGDFARVLGCDRQGTVVLSWSRIPYRRVDAVSILLRHAAPQGWGQE
jgi:hypothetical protein